MSSLTMLLVRLPVNSRLQQLSFGAVESYTWISNCMGGWGLASLTPMLLKGQLFLHHNLKGQLLLVFLTEETEAYTDKFTCLKSHRYSKLIRPKQSTFRDIRLNYSASSKWFSYQSTSEGRRLYSKPSVCIALFQASRGVLKNEHQEAQCLSTHSLSKEG